MIQSRKLLIILTAIVLSLLARELPYFNVLFLNKLWIFYVFLFFFLFPPKGIGFTFFMIPCLLGVVLISTLFNLVVFAEAVGSIAFAFMCVFFGLKLYHLLKET